MDFRGVFFHNYRILKKLAFLHYWNLLHYMKALLLNIKVGRKCKFYGNTRFVRKPNSSIIVGDSCIFRSSSLSNLIGINHPCILSTHSPMAKLVIGKSCGFSGTVIGVYDTINICDNVRCGANTLITDFDWHLDDIRSSLPSPVYIGNSVWLGINVIVLKGVSIGENTLIGANSVVTKDIPPNVIAAGNPCKVIKKL